MRRLEKRFKKATSLYVVGMAFNGAITRYRNWEMTEKELLDFVDSIPVLVRKKLKKKEIKILSQNGSKIKT